MADMAVDQCTYHCGFDDLTAALSLGSNSADASRRVLTAAAILSARYGMVAATPVFVTPDIHMRERRAPLMPIPDYANAVAVIRMPRPPLAEADVSALVVALKALEQELGRRREHKQFGLVNADIDVVTVGRSVLRPVDYVRPYFYPRMLVV